jgi:hypothetical protein
MEAYLAKTKNSYSEGVSLAQKPLISKPAIFAGSIVHVTLFTADTPIIASFFLVFLPQFR